MSRQTKERLDYFPLVCDFFCDYKIKRLKRTFGALGISTYINLLCKVYANGYYLKFDDIDDLAYAIAEEIASENDRLAKVSAAVRECISHMSKSGLVDENLFDSGIITSTAIQERYKLVCEKSKRKAQIREWNLLTGSAFNVEETQINSEEKGINSEEIPINSEFMQQNKLKEIKVNNKTVSQSYYEEDETDGLTEFCIESAKQHLTDLAVPLCDSDAQRYLDIIKEVCRRDFIKINGVEVPREDVAQTLLGLTSDYELFTSAMMRSYGTGGEIKNKLNYAISTLYNAAKEF